MPDELVLEVSGLERQGTGRQAALRRRQPLPPGRVLSEVGEPSSRSSFATVSWEPCSVHAQIRRPAKYTSTGDPFDDRVIRVTGAAAHVGGGDLDLRDQFACEGEAPDSGAAPRPHAGERRFVHW